MEQLKHECGVAMIRLLKPLEYYEEKYGTWMYGLNKLYLLMEKQHNRGAGRRRTGLCETGSEPRRGIYVSRTGARFGSHHRDIRHGAKQL